MIIVIDNYDSFTYNLVQYLGDLGADPVVRRNDAVTVDEVGALAPRAVVLSPGPCTPAEAGVTVPAVRRWGAEIPMLGVCLGHQAIGQAYGGKVVRAPAPVHGKTSLVHHDDTGVFRGLPNPFRATRYHSLVVERDCLPSELVPNAWTEDGLIMGVRHEWLPVHGVQFPPESILTATGHQILRTFLDRVPAAAG